MRFFRLLVVVILVTLCGGVFGAAVGGLTGYATPNALEVFFNVELEQTTDDLDAQRMDNESTGTTVAVAASGDKSLAVYGASLGASFGLISGAVIGLGLGVLDQLILALNNWNRQRGGQTKVS